MDKEILGAVIPMMLFKKEVYDFVESLVKEKLKERREKRLLTTDEASKILNIKVSRFEASGV